MTKTIYFTDEKVYKLAKAKASREGKSLSSVIQELLDSYITQNKKAKTEQASEKPFFIG